ncbi:MAG: cytochrome P450 [Actinomycetota bacterium]|nr:cytochrome P450 [Actinomycetota bacterium]
MAGKDFPHASILEGLRFTAQVAVPNVIQGLFRRRRAAVAVATRAGADGLAVSFMTGLKRSYGNGPLWIRVAKDEALLVIGEKAIRQVLGKSPEPFAADPEPKKSGMAHFQPDALTISRNPEWEDRRHFTENVLDTGKPVHRLADEFAAISVEEAEKLPRMLDWDTFNESVRRVTRRVILGEGAADDAELSELLGQLMDKSNPPGGGSDELYQRFHEKLQSCVDAGRPGSLAGLLADAPRTELTNPAGQVTHWLFALGDTLAINAMRCLALLAGHDQVAARVLEELAEADLRTGEGVAGLRVLEASLQEAMRLWPTTPMLSRELTSDVDWDGVKVTKGTQVVIVNTFNHRDRDSHAFADRFAPDEWLSGGAADDWSFNHFSHGPQGCPGTGLALLVGKATIGTILRDHDLKPLGSALAPDKPLPHMLDYFSLRFELVPRP